jgi:hypothetical protein
MRQTAHHRMNIAATRAKRKTLSADRRQSVRFTPFRQKFPHFFAPTPHFPALGRPSDVFSKSLSLLCAERPTLISTAQIFPETFDKCGFVHFSFFHV